MEGRKEEEDLQKIERKKRKEKKKRREEEKSYCWIKGEGKKRLGEEGREGRNVGDRNGNFPIDAQGTRGPRR